MISNANTKTKYISGPNDPNANLGDNDNNKRIEAVVWTANSVAANNPVTNFLSSYLGFCRRRNLSNSCASLGFK